MKLTLEEIAALYGQRGSDPLQQLLLLKMFDKDDKKDDKKDSDKPTVFFGYEIKKRKSKESAGSLIMLMFLVLFAYSPYMAIIQDWLEKSLRHALQ